jgi:hypothetical protein
MSKFEKGHIPWIKGKHQTEDHKRKIGVAAIRRGAKPPGRKGVKLSDSTKQKIRIANLGKKYSIETRIKKSIAQKGDKGSNWRGGITPVNNQIRSSLEYKLWEDGVKNRDNNRCVRCDDEAVKKLVAHHVLNFSSYVELRFAIDNGTTLCKSCHKKFHKIYTVKNNTREQLLEFINQ